MGKKRLEITASENKGNRDIPLLIVVEPAAGDVRQLCVYVPNLIGYVLDRTPSDQVLSVSGHTPRPPHSLAVFVGFMQRRMSFRLDFAG